MRVLLLGLTLLCLVPQTFAARSGTSLDDAVSEMRRQHDGRVISAETLRRRDGRSVHNIRILTPDGRVRRYQVDAESGRRVAPSPNRR
jgi:uncharacterized membrane protein YkoI